MGCPVPKVVNNGDGSALMKKSEACRGDHREDGAGDQKPLTVKIRKGFDDAHVNAVELAHIAQEKAVRRRSRCTAHQRAVLCRTCGLGYYPPGEGGGIYSCHWKWGYPHTGGCGGDGRADRLRRLHDRARSGVEIPGFSVRFCIILRRASTLPGRIFQR